MSNENAVPAGFHLESDTTTADGIEYPVEFLQADSVDAILAYYESEGNSRAEAESILVGVFNSHNKQNATQGPKAGIRKAKSEAGDIDAAVAAAQEATRRFVTGAPRQSAGGVTKKAAGEMGIEIAKATAAKGSPLTKAELDEIMSQYL